MNEAQRKFCARCGKEEINGVCPGCTQANATVALPSCGPAGAFQSYLMNPAEKMVCVLGNSYLQNFLSGGLFAKAFSVVTDKRLYFRGKVFLGEGLGSLQQKKVNSAVNIRDITAVRVVHYKPIGLLIFAALIMLMGLIFTATGDDAGATPMIIAMFVAGIFGLLYYFKRITMLTIMFAGGSIGFDVKWFPEQEALNYQKALFLAKDKILEQ